MSNLFKRFWAPALLIILIGSLYWQFFILHKIPVPADTLVGAYFPWLDYKWGFSVGVPVKNPPISDVFSQFFPWKYQIVDYIKHGIWPLWNPLSMSGTPILATYHSSPFLPFNALLLLPQYYGWGFYIFGQTIVAALGAFLLLGRYVKSNLARIAGGIIFSLSGLMTTWVEFGTGVWAASQLPWIFLFLELYKNDKKIRYLGGICISFTLLFLSGHAQLTLYSTLIYFSYLTYQYFKKNLPIIQLIKAGVAWALAIGTSCAALLPTISQVSLSVRGSESYSKSFNYGLNSWYEFIRLYAADFFGNPTTYNHWDSISYHEQSSFLGAIPLALILGLLHMRSKNTVIRFWSAVFGLALFMALDSPFTQWLYAQPLPFLTYSSASRTFFISSFAGAILSAYALESFLKNESSAAFRRASIILMAALVGTSTGFLISRYILTPYIGSMDADLGIENIMIGLKNSLLPLSMLVLFFVSTYFQKFKIQIVLILVLLTFFDLGRYFLKYNPFVDAKLVFPETPIHQYLKSQPGLFRIARVDPEIMTPNTWMQYGLSSIEGYDPLALKNYAHLFNRVNMGSYDNSVGRYVELTQYPSKFMDALNVKYLVAIKRDEKSRLFGDILNYRVRASDYKEVFGDKSSAVLINPHAMERAYFIHKLSMVSSHDKFVQKIDQKDFDPTTEAIVINTDDQELTFATGSATITSYTPNQVEIKTQSSDKGFVVLADTYEKGWKLYEDNLPKDYFEANGALRGFFVEPGTHQYTFKYWPKSFDWGLKISGLSLVLLLATTLYSIRRGIW